RWEDEWGAQGAGPQAERLVADVEGAAGGPEESSGAQVADRFLEVKPLEQVEDAECEQQQNRELKGAQAAAVEVVGADEECDRGGKGERMEDVQLLDRFDL